MPNRLVTLTAAILTIAAGLGAGAAWPGEMTLDGMTRAQAEQAAATSGELFDPNYCPPPTHVVCRARNRHWRCTVTFPGGAQTSGDPAPHKIQLQMNLCR